jgi:hypothetical protein
MSEEKKKKETGLVVESKKELATNEIKDLPSNSADLLLSQAVEKNLPVESLERLIDLRAKMKAEAAKEAFDLAMADFQGECPVIEKKKKAMDGSKVLYAYAPLDAIVKVVSPILAKHGLSYSIQTETIATGVKVTCFAKHKFGHTEPSTMEIPLGVKTAIMSQSQQVAAAITFAKRYAFCNAFGIMTGEEDNENFVKDAPKKDATNYIDKLKMALYKKVEEINKENGVKEVITLRRMVSLFNEITGCTAKEMPTTQKGAQEMLELLNSQVTAE